MGPPATEDPRSGSLHNRGAAVDVGTDLPLDRFHIPLLMYAPKHIAPARIDTIASQIDVAPTVLALLNFVPSS